MSLDFQTYVFSPPYFGWLGRGVAMTLIVTVATTFGSMALAFPVASATTSRSGAARAVGRSYVALFRNLPLVPLLLFLVFGLPGVWPALFARPFPAGQEFFLLLVGLSLNTSAYLAEILRAAIQSVPARHVEAARVLGLSGGAIVARVVYPQALRIAAPAAVTRLIHNMKNSTVALVLPLPVEAMEVVGQAGRIAGATFAWAEPLLFAAAVHLTLATTLSVALNGWAQSEKRRIEGGL